MRDRSLQERLARFDRPPRSKQISARRGSGAEAVRALAEERGGQWIGTRSRGYVRFDRRLDSTSLPGPPHEIVPPEAWHRLGGSPGEVPRPWAVLDTETTGLESGTGVLVFLVGVVYWDDAGARLVQYFLPEPAGEPAFLEDIVGDLERAGAFLSFNGKSFDVPRLATRLALNRIDAARLVLPHLDLLHPCRRLMRGEVEGCRLASVERVLMGHARVDDMPGWEVPEVYRSLLVEGVDLGLGRILDHNAQDVLNLVWIASIAADAFLGRRAPSDLPGAARLAVGRSLEIRGRAETAEAFYRSAAECDEPETCRLARWHLALLHRRRGEWDEARHELEFLVARWPSWIDPRVELAKLLEHRQANLTAARDVVHEAMRALELAGLEGASTPRSDSLRAELSHRLRRLERRLRGVSRGERTSRRRL